MNIGLLLVYGMAEELNTKNKQYMKKTVCILFIVAIFCSCATLPKETVEMSLMLDQQLTALQESHLDIAELYCLEKEKEAISLLDNEWYPAYLNKLFDTEYVSEVWQDIVNSQNKSERMAMIKAITQISQEDYKVEKDNLMRPIIESRAELRKVILSEYQKAKDMNLTITNNIASVNDVQEVRKNYLSKVVNIDKIDYQIEKSANKIDSVFNKTQDLIDKYKKNEDKINRVIDKLK